MYRRFLCMHASIPSSIHGPWLRAARQFQSLFTTIRLTAERERWTTQCHVALLVYVHRCSLRDRCLIDRLRCVRACVLVKKKKRGEVLPSVTVSLSALIVYYHTLIATAVY